MHERDLDSTSEAGAGRAGRQLSSGGLNSSGNQTIMAGSESERANAMGGAIHSATRTVTVTASSLQASNGDGGSSASLAIGGVSNSGTVVSSGGSGGTTRDGSAPATDTAVAGSAGTGGTAVGNTAPSDPAGTSSGGTASGGTASGGPASGGPASGGTAIGGTATTTPVCYIAQRAYEDGRENPVNSCEHCQISSSTSSWTSRPNGFGCPGGFCQSGECTPGCWIDATLVAPDVKQVGNDCRACQPSTLNTDWSNLSDGTGCASGKICHAGSCEAACFIAGAVVPSNTASSTRACGVCDPTADLTQWSRRKDCFRSLALGKLHSCARVDSGRVWCWGNNREGQLGDNSTMNSSSPVAVEELLATDIAVGDDHSCAIRSEGGSVACWGSNEFGKLGASTSATQSVVPTSVLNVTGARALAAGYGHTCALLESRGIQCWGYNGYGQLGRGDTADAPVAAAVSSIDNAIAITAGYSHTCALLDTRTVKCWGYNVSGQLGTSDKSHRYAPTDVRDLSEVRAISAGYSHTCALTQGGTVKCWGSNASGEVGDGTNETRLSPVSVKNLTSVVEIAAGHAYTCARTSEGAVWCWGLNDAGQFGNGPTSATNPSTSNVAVQSSSLARAGALSAGENHACAALVGGGIQCWGDDLWGQLGNGPATDADLPVDVVGF